MRRFLSVPFLSATCIAQTNSTPAILTNSEGERYDLKFGTAIMKATSVQTCGTWSMVDFTASPGTQTMRLCSIGTLKPTKPFSFLKET